MSIKQYMLNHNLNQAELAKLCGVTQRAISHGIANDYIIINGTVYSPRFHIDESELTN